MAAFDVSVILKFTQQGIGNIQKAHEALQRLQSQLTKMGSTAGADAGSKWAAGFKSAAHKAAEDVGHIMDKASHLAVKRLHAEFGYMRTGLRDLQEMAHLGHPVKNFRKATGMNTKSATAGVSDEVTQRTLTDLMGLPPDVVKRLYSSADKYSQEYTTLSRSGMVAIARDLTANMKDPADAAKATAEMAKAAQLLALNYGSTEKGLEAARQYYRAADIMGMADNSADLAVVLEAMVRRTVRAGKDIDPRTIAQTVANMKGARFGMGPEAIGDIISLRDTVQGQAANFLRTFYGDLTRDSLNAKGKFSMMKYGLRDSLGAKNGALLQRDPFEYTMQVIKPILLKMGVDLNNPDQSVKSNQIGRALTRLGFTPTGMQLPQEFLMKEDEVRRDRERASHVKYTEEFAKKLGQEDWKSAVVALDTAWKDAWSALTRPLHSTATGVMGKVSNLMKSGTSDQNVGVQRWVTGIAMGTAGIGKYVVNHLPAITLVAAAWRLKAAAAALSLAAAKMGLPTAAAAMGAVASRSRLASIGRFLATPAIFAVGVAANLIHPLGAIFTKIFGPRIIRGMLGVGGAASVAGGIGGTVLRMGAWAGLAAGASAIHPLLGAFVSLLMFRGPIISMFTRLAGLFSGMFSWAAGAGAAAAGIGRLGIAFRLLMVTTGIGAVILGVTTLIGYWHELSTVASSFWTTLKSSWQGSEIQALFHGVRDGIKSAFSGTVDIIAGWGSTVSGWFAKVGISLDPVINMFNTLYNAIAKLFSFEFGSLFGDLDSWSMRAGKIAWMASNPISAATGRKTWEDSEQYKKLRAELDAENAKLKDKTVAPPRPISGTSPSSSLPASEPARAAATAMGADVRLAGQAAAADIKSSGTDVAAALRKAAAEISAAAASLSGSISGTTRGSLSDAGAPRQ
jgi:hypothetical protein